MVGNKSFTDFCSRVNCLTPLNDVGERAVKMSADFFGCLAQDKEQRQALLQNVDRLKKGLLKTNIAFLDKLLCTNFSYIVEH